MTALLDEERSGSRPAGRRSGGAWIVVGLAALAIFDLTANPVLAVAVGCLKFGWDELATARWLWARDPDRARGRAVALAFAASALGRATCVAIVVMMLVAWASQPILALMRMRGRPVPDVAAEFVAAGVVALSGSAATVLASIVAVASAWWARVRVWVGPEVKVARRIDRWPPASIHGGPGSNRVRWVATVAILPLAIPVVFVLILAVALVVHVGQVTLGPLLPPWALILPGGIAMLAGFATVAFVPAGLVLHASDVLCARIAAESPEACWSARGPLGDADH